MVQQRLKLWDFSCHAQRNAQVSLDAEGIRNEKVKVLRSMRALSTDDVVIGQYRSRKTASAKLWNPVGQQAQWDAQVSLDAEDIRNEKVKVLRSMRALSMDDVVIGQYRSLKTASAKLWNPVGQQAQWDAQVSLDAEDIRNEKVKVLRSMRALSMDDVVIGQYRSRKTASAKLWNPVGQQAQWDAQVSLDAEDIRNEKVKVLRSMRALSMDDVVIGQYRSRKTASAKLWNPVGQQAQWDAQVSLDAEDIRNEKVKVLRSMRALSMDDVVIGQYRSRKNGVHQAARLLGRQDRPARQVICVCMLE